ncbi:MAG TPA: hypothetical protein VMF29_07055 [Candidatus Edwardsbacteria bacterium]|nr:hypothetical protein [Candidatus Edwardsbacteria bacterium]
MNARTIILGAAAVIAAAVIGLTRSTAQRDTTGQSPRAPQEQQQASALTAGQQATVASILAKYDKNSLTAADARAINDAFREAGLRGGPALRDAIAAAGYDPEAIGKLAPPPDRGAAGRQGQPGDGVGRQGGGQRESQDGHHGSQGDGQSGQQPQENGGGKRDGGGRQQGAGGGYSLEQAISDRAQLTTIAFDGLAFMTGDFGCNTFLPPGKVSDFFGFQYMRDVDAAKLGHNTSFLTRIANNMLAILNDAQKQQLVALAKEQEPGISELALKRFPLIKSFCRLKDGDTPSGKPSLDRDQVKRYTAEIYALSGKLAYRRAQVLGAIDRSFDDAQKAKLAALKFGDSSTWPEIADQLDKRSYSHGVTVAVMTYASELFSWYAGSAEGDTYFCPEGHGTYFGAFYMKDMPAMGNANYSISTSITGDNGEQFLASLTADQRAQITKLVDLQRGDLNEIVQTRRAIATLLRDFITSGSVDQDRVAALSRRYGELDGEISFHYATAFASVYKTLTTAQKAALVKLRNLDGYQCKGAFLYSQPIAMPEVANTDFLFSAR